MSTEVEKIKKSLVGFKGWWTRAVNSATPYADGSKAGTPEVLNIKINDLTSAKEKVEDALAKLQIAAPASDGSTELKEQQAVLDSLQEAYDNLVDLLCTRISEAEHSSRENRTPCRDPPRAVKAVSVLKPEVLRLDTPPASLDAWITSFEEYFEASNFSACETAKEAQGYLKRCLDEKLSAALELRVDGNTPVTGGASACLSELKKIFDEKFPIHSRRLTAFNLKQSPGTDFLEFYAGTAERVFTAADIKNMSPEDIQVFLLMSAASDKELCKEFFKLEKPTLKGILSCARTHQAIKANQEAGNAEANTCAAVQVHGPHELTMNEAREALKKKGYKCFSCSSMSRRTPACPIPKRYLDCSHCGKGIGHVTEICFKHLNGGDSVSMSRDRNRSRERHSGDRQRSFSGGRRYDHSNSRAREDNNRDRRPGTPYYDDY